MRRFLLLSSFLALSAPGLAAQCAGGGGGGPVAPPISWTPQLPNYNPLPVPTGGAAPASPFTPNEAPAPSTPGGIDRPQPVSTSGNSSVAAVTGSSDLGRDASSWVIWWELNREQYLDWSTPAVQEALTASEGALAGLGGLQRRPDASAKLRARFQSEVLPALDALLEDGDSATVPAALEAMARTGADAEAIASALGEYVASPQRVAEVAVLSHGFLDQPEAFRKLLGLAKDDRSGRALVGRAVPGRVRAFAVYALGMFGADPEQRSLNQIVGSTLVDLLDDDGSDLDLQVACVVALGQLELRDPTELGRALLAVLEDDARSALVQAHVPVAVAKLLRRTPSQALEGEAVQRLVTALDSRSSSAELRQSAAQALGLLVPAQSPFAPRVVALLQRAASADPNRQVRNFALMALGYVGATGTVESPLVAKEVVPFLLRQLRKSSTAQRPWAGLALGVLGARARAAGRPELPAAVGESLAEAFEDTKAPSSRGAFALALGLMRYEPAEEVLHEAWHDSRDPDFLGHCSVGLALLGTRQCGDDFVSLMDDAKDRPALLRDAAVALALLGDARGRDTLVARLAEPEESTLNEIAAASFALRWVGDETSVETLVAFLGADGTQSWARAFTCEALGAIGDDGFRARRASLCSDLNYVAAVPSLFDLRAGTGAVDRL